MPTKRSERSLQSIDPNPEPWVAFLRGFCIFPATDWSFGFFFPSKVKVIWVPGIYIYINMAVSKNKGGPVPQNGWCTSWKSLLKIHDLGGPPLFVETLIYSLQLTCLPPKIQLER